MSQNQEELIDSLMKDISVDVNDDNRPEIVDTLTSILKDYNLDASSSFVERVASLKFNNKNDTIDINSIPTELRDAAFLPVNTIADIALRQDLDMVISQIPELYKAVQVARDAICEADVVTGRLARSISFDKRVVVDEADESNAISKIEKVEKNLGLDSMIKNHVVFNSLLYGEAYMYVVPYSKVFKDLYTYKTAKKTKNKNNDNYVNMFDTYSTFGGYGYNESETVEISLKDAIFQENSTIVNISDKEKCQIFTESEIMDIRPDYHAEKYDDDKDPKVEKKKDTELDNTIKMVADNIHYINRDIAIPVIEESAHDLSMVYAEKYRRMEADRVGDVKTFFEQVMGDASPSETVYDKIKGVYLRILPATKLIPIRIDQTVIGYYYISDMTRPESAGERRNSGLAGYTLNSPSVGFDAFTPDQMFCEKVANKIINNFDMKFMRDNIALHKQIVAVLMGHKFNESMLRFVFIPAENVVQFTLNKDGMGKGHSIIEPALPSARMYMFLKLYSLLYQINNSAIRVYNIRMSGIDKDYKKFIQEQMRKFSSRRVTTSDIFNYRSSMGKVTGGSELMMITGTQDKPPVTIDNIPASEAPINNELLESMKDECLNGTPVPATMIKGTVAEADFSKQVEIENTLFHSTIASDKIDMNNDVTRFYQIVMRWETDIDPKIIESMTYTFRMPTAKQLNITTEMINNFNTTYEMIAPTFLKPDELKHDENAGFSDTERNFRKACISEFLPQINIDRFEQLADDARLAANKSKLSENGTNENSINDLPEEGMM